MSESLTITATNRHDQYAELFPQLEALVQGEDDAIANIANICAAIAQALGFFWVGCYRVQGNMLCLGPFRGDIACTRIPRGRGVCGTAWAEDKTLVVPDVEAFPGHIACSSLSRSEIVAPIRHEGQVVGVLDIDSLHLNEFDDTTDRLWVDRIADLLAPFVAQIAQC